MQPTPIAELAARLERMGDDFPEPLERNAGHLFEAIVQYTASIAIAAYLKIDARDPRVEGALKQLRGMPTLGIWNQCIREICNVVSEPKLEKFVRPALSAIATEYRAAPQQAMSDFGALVRDLQGNEEGVATHETQFDTTAGFVDFVIAYRNRKAHGGILWFEQHVRALASPFAKAVRSLLDAFGWMTRHPLFAAQSIEAKGASFLHKGSLLAGETPKKDVELELGHRLDSGIVFDPNDLAVRVTPFYVQLPCASPLCYGSRVFAVGKGFTESAQTYVHAFCGTAIENGEHAEAWAEIFRPRRQESRISGVVFEQQVDPSDRPVKTGEAFRVRVRVRNFTRAPVTGVWLELPLPPEVESIEEKAAQRERLDPGKEVDFEYTLRTHEEGRVAIPAGTLHYQVENGKEVTRPIDEIQIAVAFNDFPGLVGREAEIERLEDHFAHASTGHLRIAVITGDSGAGKTATIATFLERLAGKRAIVLRNRCYEEDLHPFSSFNALLKSFLLHHCDREKVDAALRDIASTSVADLASQEVLIGDLLSVLTRVVGASSSMLRKVAENSELAAGWMDGGRRTELYAAINDAFLAIVARAPLVLYFENIHALHKDGWRLLRYLARQLEHRPVLILACMSAQAPNEDTADNVLPIDQVRPTLHQLGADFIDLLPLGPEKMHELFALLLPQSVIGEAQKNAILEFSQGFPSWLVETVRVLRTQGHIERSGGAWRMTGEELAISEAFSDMIRQRHDSLDPLLRSVVDNAAILGKRFSREMLGEIPVDRSRKLLSIELNAFLRQLKEIHHILREGELDLEFAHARIHDIIYTKISPSIRRELHRSVAEILEQKDDPARWCMELAFHWTRAQEPGRSLGHLEKSAERLEKSMAYEEACRTLERALKTAEERPGLRDENWRFDIVRKLARLHWLSGNVDTSIRLDGENVERGLELRRFREVCEILRILSITHTFRSDLDRAWQVAMRGKEIATRHNLRESVEKMNLQLGLLARDRRKLDEAERLLKESRDYAAGAGLTWLEADASRHLGVLHRMKGELRSSRQCFDRALSLFDALDGSSRLFGLGMTYDNVAALSLQVGDLDLAEHELDKSLQFRRQAKDAIGLSRGLYGRAKLLFSRGRVAEARARIDESVEIKKKIEDDEGIAKCRELEGQILAEMDDWSAALSAFTEALAIYDRLKKTWKTPRIRLAMARVHLAMGQEPRARELVEEARNADPVRMDAAARVDLALVDADILRRKADFAGAEKMLASVLPTLQDIVDDALKNQVDVLYSLISIELDRPDRAIELLESGLSRKACQDNPYVAARFYNLLGKALRKARQFDRAIAELERGLIVIKSIEDPLGEALALDELGKIELDRERLAEARGWFEKALAVKRRINDERGVRISHGLLERCR
jgi:tetratricopeptide (TPR) repeat protein